ncbi:MAG: matrixin family metalloprotease [Candidatus Binatia bacterium]
MSRACLTRNLACVAIVLVVVLRATAAQAFACLQINGRCVRWVQHGATLRAFLGSPAPGTVLLNGTLNWDQNAINAANDWNSVGAAFRFTVTVGGQFFDPCGPRGPNHACPNTGPVGDNPIFFAGDFCGSGFGDVIELTNNCAERTSGALLNAPVLVNANVDWNAYDGDIRVVNGRVLNDVRRVLLHEFGHVLGLDHPDDNGQDVVAIMNSREGNIDRLQSDDIGGILSIYPNSVANSGDGSGSGCQTSVVGAAGSGWLLLLPAALALLHGRRRHRRRGP